MPAFIPVHPPRNPDECATWLYEAIQRLNRAATFSFSAVGSIVRGESPDSSGSSLVDLTKFFYKPGLSGGQKAFGATGPAGVLTLSSTASGSKGFINFGDPTVKMALDEAQGLLGINTATPASTLHIVGSTSGSGSSLVPSSDINTPWNAYQTDSWIALGGTRAAAMATDDGTTSLAALNDGAAPPQPQWCGLSGTITPGKTYTVTLRVTTLSVAPTPGLSNYLAITLVDSAGNGWTSTGGSTESFSSVNSPLTEILTPSPTFYTVTRTVVCSGTPALTGSTANSIRIFAGAQTSGPASLYVGVTSIAVAQAGSSLIRWDLSSGARSGGVDIAGRLGIGTGSTSLVSMITAVSDAASTIGISVKGATSQTGDLVQLLDSTGTILGGRTASGNPYLVVGGAINKFLQSNSSGVGSWAAQAALTKTDDTNVTLTLGGSPTIALTAATSLTLGWTGTLSVARGGTGSSTALGGFNALSPLTTRGDLLTRDATNNIRLSIGAAGTFLVSNGTDASWSRTITQAATAGVPAFKIVTEATPTTGIYQFVITDNAGVAQCYYDSNNGSIFVAPNIIATTSLLLGDPLSNAATITTSAIGIASYNIPNVGSGSDFVLTSGVQTLANKTLNVNSALTASTISSGCAFQHTGDTSKKLRFILSGMTTAVASAFSLVHTAARTVTFRDLSGGVVLDSGSVLTSGRVPFVTTGGALLDNASFLFSAASGLTLTALNIITDTTTGMKIGTANNQKLGFWNTAPIIQPVVGGAAAAFAVVAGVAVTDTCTFDGYTLGQVVKALRNMGLLT